MTIRMPGGMSVATPAGPMTFRTTNAFTFAFSGTGAERTARVTDDEGSTSTFRFSETPTSVPLNDYVGTYHSPELDADYTIRTEGDTLVLRYAHFPPERLTPAYRDGFSGSGRSIRFVRGAGGQVTELRIFAGRVRNVKFVRVTGG